MTVESFHLRESGNSDPASERGLRE